MDYQAYLDSLNETQEIIDGMFSMGWNVKLNDLVTLARCGIEYPCAKFMLDLERHRLLLNAPKGLRILRTFVMVLTWKMLRNTLNVPDERLSTL